jgi:hypothetical protein
VTIISTGLDLTNPDNFRALQWSVTPEEVVAAVKKAGAEPALHHGPVTFVLVPTAGSQPQLGQAQKRYLKAVWTALLKAAGATSVTFIDATATTASSAAPSAATVAIPALPTTPIAQVRSGNSMTCTALAARTSFALDGWASYEGPLNADGQPEFDYPVNQKLSKERVQTIANLLVNELRVPRPEITRMTWHGNLDLPNPNDPRSPANRVVTITCTAK